MQAMILAAGFGTRLLPHTKIRPKPLFPVINTPLLLLTIDRLKHFGFSRIVVNCHYLREQIVQAVAEIPGVIVQEEEKILGTGGGLRQALTSLDEGPLLVTNGDIYHTIDLGQLYMYHGERGNAVTMAMHDYPRFNTVAVQNDRIVGFGAEDSGRALAFTGIHVVNPEILRDIAEGEFSCIISRYKELIARGVRIDCYRVDDCFWTDMGTEADYLELHRKLLNREVPVWKEIPSFQGSHFVHPEAELPEDCIMEDWVCLGNSKAKPVTQFSRSVVWDGVEIAGEKKIRDKLVSQSITA